MRVGRVGSIYPPIQRNPSSIAGRAYAKNVPLAHFLHAAAPSVACGDSSPVKGELYFVGRGFPDVPMHHVILWGATTPARQTTLLFCTQSLPLISLASLDSFPPGEAKDPPGSSGPTTKDMSLPAQGNSTAP